MRKLMQSLAVLFFSVALALTLVPALGTQAAYAVDSVCAADLASSADSVSPADSASAADSVYAPTLDNEYGEIVMHVGPTYAGWEPAGIGSYSMPVYQDSKDPQLHIEESWADENGEPLTGCFEMDKWYIYTVTFTVTGLRQDSGFNLEAYRICVHDPYWNTWSPAADYDSKSIFEAAATSHKLTFIYKFLPAPEPASMGDKTFGLGGGSCKFQGSGEYSGLYNFFLINEETLHPFLTTDFDYETDDFANSRIDLDKDGSWDLSIDTYGGEDIWDSEITLTRLDTCSVSGQYTVDLPASLYAMGVYLDCYYDHFVFDFDHKANPFKARGKTAKVKARKLKHKNVKIDRGEAINISKAKGHVTYKKLGGDENLTIAPSTGKITVRKGTKKGSYSMNLTAHAAGNSKYAAAAQDILVTVNVK